MHELPGLLQRGRRRDAAEIFASPFMVATDPVFQFRLGQRRRVAHMPTATATENEESQSEIPN